MSDIDLRLRPPSAIRCPGHGPTYTHPPFDDFDDDDVLDDFVNHALLRALLVWDPPSGFEVEEIPRSRSIPFDLEVGILPRLALGLDLSWSDDIADYAFEVSWAFFESDLDVLEEASHLRNEPLNPLQDFAHYLASLMPLSCGSRHKNK